MTFWFAAKKPDSCPNIPINLRFDCHPDGWEINQDSCLARGCCWNPPNSYQENRVDLNIPVIMELFFIQIHQIPLLKRRQVFELRSQWKFHNNCLLLNLHPTYLILILCIFILATLTIIYKYFLNTYVLM